MFIIKRTAEFDAWLFGLRDTMARIRLAKRLDKVQRGLLGGTKPVGEGVHGLREDFGPGWRMYYTQRGDVLVVMLGGGAKPPSRPTLRPRLPYLRLWNSGTLET